MQLVSLTCHDFFFFASHDYGSCASPENVINKYALMYALNREITEVRRLISLSTPHYLDDLPLMETYATAATSLVVGSSTQKSGSNATPSCHPKIGHKMFTENYGDGLAGFTWNSLGETLLDSMKQDRLNLPKTGLYYKLKPLSLFHFFAIGNDLPGVIRIGKKQIPARLNKREMEMTLRRGEFSSSCPVVIADLPDDTEILSGSFLTVPPTPLLISAKLRGRYIEIRDGTKATYQIPIPSVEKFTNSIGRMEGMS